MDYLHLNTFQDHLSFYGKGDEYFLNNTLRTEGTALKMESDST